MPEKFEIKNSRDDLGKKKGLSRKEKAGFLGLIILSIVVVYFGFRQIKNNIHGPFSLALKPEEESTAPEEKNDAILMEELKAKDTDKDGLSDHDELYVYNTSPYLTDTDSDGIGDKEEISKGTDPNCPTGQKCGLSEITNPAAGKISTSTWEQPVAELPSGAQLLLQSLLGSNPDPKVLREFLLKEGADKKILDQFSDQEIASLFKQFLTSPTSTVSEENIGPDDFNQIQESFKTAVVQGKIDLKQVRELLRQNGMSEGDLKKIDDKTLLEMLKGL